MAAWRTSRVVLLTLAIASMVQAETVPEDGDAWSEYADWPTAYNDGWSPECGLTLQLITPATPGDYQVGLGSVGFELQTGIWNKRFYYQNAEWASGGEPMDGFTAVAFWYKTTWETVSPRFGFYVYMEPTLDEQSSGITEKRLYWQFPTSTTWTQFSGSFEDAQWECYAGGMWSPCAEISSLTSLLKLEWSYFEIFGPGAGNRTMIDGLHFQAGPPTSVPDGLAQGKSRIQSHPNPFRFQTTIRFRAVDDGRIPVVIHNPRGERVRTLWSLPIASGQHEVVWDGRDDRGEFVSAGNYFVSAVMGGGIPIGKKVIVLGR